VEDILMRLKPLLFATALALACAGPAVAAPAWHGNADHARALILSKYKKNGTQPPTVADTGRTFTAGGVVWRVFSVTWPGGGFRHVAVTRQRNGQYLAIEGLDKSHRWSHGVPIGR
jgi:hypothetical protein